MFIYNHKGITSNRGMEIHQILSMRDFSQELANSTELWALLQVEIYWMPGSNRGFQRNTDLCLGFWMVMGRSIGETTTTTTTTTTTITTTTTTTFAMTSWNMVESVKKHACLLTARLHSTYLSKSIGFANDFFEFVLGSFKPDFVSKESVHWPLHNRSAHLLGIQEAAGLLPWNMTD